MAIAAQPAGDGRGGWVRDVLLYWFDELGPTGWFKRSEETDAAIRERFAGVIDEIAAAPIEHLKGDAETALAALIVLDQFPRNVFRNTPRAFAYDGKALSLARASVGEGLDRAVPKARRLFVYLPFEHSEDLADQDIAVQLISSLGDAGYTGYAEAHRDVVARFGRFPHRNAILGRASTAEEEAYLSEPGSGF